MISLHSSRIDFFGGERGVRKIQKKFHTISWQRKRKKDDHIHRKGEREMADEEVEVKTEPPFAVKAGFVLVFASLFLAYPLYTCFFDSPSELPHDFLDRVVEFYGIEKSEVKAYLFYMTLFLGTLIIVLTIVFFMMLVIECIYSFLFGGLIFGRTFMKDQTKGHKVMKEVKEELVKMNQLIKENSIFEVIEVLKNIHKDSSIARITNSPMTNTPAPSPTLTTQASESESDLTGDDENHSPKKRGRRKGNASSSSSSKALEQLDSFPCNLEVD